MMNRISQRLNDGITRIDAELNRIITALDERKGFGSGYCRELFKFTEHSRSAVKLIAL